MSLPHVTLHGFIQVAELPDLSPFVSKVAVYLQYQGWPYTIKSTDTRKAPRGKLPFVEVNGRKITDSDVIITELEKLHPTPLGLDTSEYARGIGKAIQSMMEHHFYFLAVRDRWGEASSWPVLKPFLVEYLTNNGVPRLVAGPLAGFIRKQVAKSTATQGVGRLSPQERSNHAKAILDSLETLLKSKPFLGGDKIDRVDFTAFCMLRGYSIKLFSSELTSEIQSRPVIMDYVERVKQAIYSVG